MTLCDAIVLRDIQLVAQRHGVALAANVAAELGIKFNIALAILLPFCSRREVARQAR